MSSSCLSGGRAAAYRLELLDLGMIKSPSSTSWISSSSSPSSTLSESSNCPLAISTRKHRAPRKRPNQSYDEAAAILSTAYPKLFPTKHLTKLKRSFHTKNITFQPDTSDFLMPFQPDDSSGCLLRPAFREKLRGRLGTFPKSCRSPGETESDVSGMIGDDGREDFDGKSIILDEEINCIMGNLGARSESIEGFDIFDEINSNYVDDNCNFTRIGGVQAGGFCYGYPVWLGFEYGPGGVRKETRNVDGGDNWWRFPSVGTADKAAINSPAEKKKKKKKKAADIKCAGAGLRPRKSGGGLLLKLNYEGVLKEWSDKASPFAGESEPVAGNDVQVRLAQIDLLWDKRGIREASVLRYKEKRRNRLFSKKIIQVYKVNADRRPRIKGQFVRTPNSSCD
ncbi:Protein CHLOROPLAST IMPORT APPARATUS 2 [Striga hermonthica]|uniref:Protein CHLOROPLAST IMPORT APPARATUS 2 n=1 Tax=Striga hermonthica TaxID=68872 RepID=A0A9N7N3Q3_STRHE|nr:Protein CHLOROPLAST IMPORT APPARATUS 2 [Striga hermonthica]